MATHSRPVAGTSESPEMDERTAAAVVAEVDEQHYDECPMCYEFLLPHQRKFNWDCACRLPFHADCIIAWVELKQEHQRCPTCNARHTRAVRQRLSQCCQEAHQRPLSVRTTRSLPRTRSRSLPRTRSLPRSRSIVRIRRFANVVSFHVRCCPYLQISPYIQIAGGPSPQFYVDERCALRHNEYGDPFWRCTVCRNHLEENHEALRVPDDYNWPHCRVHGHLVADIDLITGKRTWMCSIVTPTPSHQATTVNCSMLVTSLNRPMETNRSEYASQLGDFVPPLSPASIGQRWQFQTWPE